MATQTAKKKTGNKASKPQKTRTKRQKASRPVIAVSACLAGERVRWNGGRKLDPFIKKTLSKFFVLTTICPEVSIGLGVPREPIRLEGTVKNSKLVGLSSPKADHTTAMGILANDFARSHPSLHGFIFKSASPTCGLEKVEVFPPKGGKPLLKGQGKFAALLTRLVPMLPVIEEEALGDPLKRDHFLARVFAYHRWQSLVAEGCTQEKILAFHRRHEFSLMAHGAATMKQLGVLAANKKNLPPKKLQQTYEKGFMELMARPTTPKSHGSVMTFLAKPLLKKLSAVEARELKQRIADYQAGKTPRTVPLTLLRHHLQKHGDADVNDQVYLEPTPAEMILRAAG